MIDKLQYITHDHSTKSHVDLVREACEAGVGWIQLRMKNATDKEIMDTGRKVRAICDKYQAIFILNDKVHLVDPLEADGVHVGLNDMSVEKARDIIGNKIIGGTASKLADIDLHVSHGADYVGVGPYSFTETKENLSPILGLEGYQDLINELGVLGVDIPIVAIGGITLDDIPDLFMTGIDSIAVSGLLIKAFENPGETSSILELINQLKIV